MYYNSKFKQQVANQPNFIKLTNLATPMNGPGNPESVICLEMVSLNSTTPKTECLTPNIDS